MKRILLLMVVSVLAMKAMAQKTTTDTTTKKQSIARSILGDHSDDHFMFQLGYSDFFNKRDSIGTRGIGRSFNAYFMKAFPLSKTDKRLAFAVGLGFGNDNYYLNKELVDLKQTYLQFQRDTIDNYRRSKLSASFIEIPAELRFDRHPDDLNNTWKFALGVKFGALLSAHTKVKYIRDINNFTDYTLKEKSNKDFNPIRIAPYFRFGYGVFSLFFQVTATSFIKLGDGPQFTPYTAGIGISGL